MRRVLFAIMLLATGWSVPLAAAPVGFWETLAQARWIQEGRQGPLIYVFMDPNCPYCHVLYDRLQPFIRKGRVVVRFIPVGMLTPSSAGKAAAILESADPQKALAQNEKGFHGDRGAIAPVTPTPAIEKMLRHNLYYFSVTDATGVPATLYKKRNGQVSVITGVPSPDNLAKILQAL
ncbi:thiol:disulfide interchange protein DsbG [Acidithiobacillus sp.]|jgi:thiol:disulfide interchange protein DsbG|uniref:thiol:disulfide interchange protein DsbG n=1 Tax=Acidithiobacillus sp. TaxID=1872118 RepID=UPI0025C3D3AD|nr:thiol:disulfide interchange protein DsbG [Acidithiobacillus sp.]MCK9189815.1 thiol:disulfide interchange protein DsbG [Acidithiobacillus sp.]MCK9360127.1 thiol:disulfide interchange protein DsbG [Acidithiobacillus sp.]